MVNVARGLPGVQQKNIKYERHLKQRSLGITPPAEHTYYLYTITQPQLAAALVGLYTQTNTAGRHQQHGSRTGICTFPTQHTEQTHPGSASSPRPAALPALPKPAPQPCPNLEEHLAEGTLSCLEALRRCWQPQRRLGPAVKWRPIPSWHPRRRSGRAPAGASPERQGFKGTGKSLLGMDKW